MKKIYLTVLALTQLIGTWAHAEHVHNKQTHQAFMTPRDRLKDTTSGISIQATGVFTVTGLYIQNVKITTTTTCDTTYYDNTGKILGEMWGPAAGVSFTSGASQPIGQNYLYSMMMTYLYEANIASTSGVNNTPGNAAGVNNNNPWCIELGIMQGAPAKAATSAITNTTSTDTVLTNLVAGAAQIIITCSDSTQTCTAASTTQNFPA